jgi:chromate transporter
MSEPSPAASAAPAPAVAPPAVGVGAIFAAFLAIGATSFGGGVVAYLRESLVGRHRWVDDREFVELLSISQSLPGLNATNMAMLVGDRLRGVVGAIAALCGICLPGAVIMYVAGALYHEHGDRPLVTAALHGVAAAAVGLILATTVQLSRKSLSGLADLAFVALAVVGVNRLHLSVPWVLLGVGCLAILWHRPRGAARAGSDG